MPIINIVDYDKYGRIIYVFVLSSNLSGCRVACLESWLVAKCYLWTWLRSQTNIINNNNNNNNYIEHCHWSRKNIYISVQHSNVWLSEKSGKCFSLAPVLLVLLEHFDSVWFEGKWKKKKKNFFTVWFERNLKEKKN